MRYADGSMLICRPLGVFEFPAFAKGTEQAMWDMVTATQRGATTIIGMGNPIPL